MKPVQLELVTLTVTPEESRMIQTALVDRALHFKAGTGTIQPELSTKYGELANRVYLQSQGKL